MKLVCVVLLIACGTARADDFSAEMRRLNEDRYERERQTLQSYQRYNDMREIERLENEREYNRRGY